MEIDSINSFLVAYIGPIKILQKILVMYTVGLLKIACQPVLILLIDINGMLINHIICKSCDATCSSEMLILNLYKDYMFYPSEMVDFIIKLSHLC